MYKNRLKIIAPIALLCGALLVANPTFASDLVVSPDLSLPYGAHEIWAHNQMGESFIATASNAKVGFLVSYSAQSAAQSAPNAPIATLVTKIYAGEGFGTAPLGQIQTTIDTTTNGFVDFDLVSAGITLIPGNTYTLGMTIDNRGWINPASCVYPVGAQPTGSYDLGHPFFQGVMTTNETGICDNSFHIVDQSPTVTPIPQPTVVPTAAPTPAPTSTPVPTVTPSTVVSTGKKTEGKGTIVAVSENAITVGKVLVRYTANTVLKMNYITQLVIGQNAQYKGLKNTDGSVTATMIEIQ